MSIRNEPAFNYHGMSYRQWLIGMALQGLLSNPKVTERTWDTCEDTDAMRSELSWMAMQQADSQIYEMERQSTFTRAEPPQ